MSAETFSTRSGAVSGYLHRPSEASGDGLVLTHGAGGNCESPLLVKVAGAFSGAGFLVFRCNLPFRQKKRSGPPFPAQSEEDRKGLREAAEELRAMGMQRVFLGGHSYGGRQASILAADDPSISSGLLLLSYPLHPPKKPAQLRTAHFPRLVVPCLFVHGNRDPFGSPNEMHAALEMIPGMVRFSIVEGAGHDLGRADVNKIVKEFQTLL